MPDTTPIRELRRAQIVAAARKIVVERGLDALTFAALERELGYTRGVITWHFDNKDEIVRALLDDAVAEIDAVALAAIRSEATLTERARAVVREMVRGWLGGSGAGAVLVAHWGRLKHSTEAEERVTALYARYRGYSSRLVRIGQERGEFRPDIDPEALGAVLVAMVLGVVIQHLFDPEALPLDEVIREAGELVVARLER